MPKINPSLPLDTHQFANATLSYTVGKPLRAGRRFTVTFTDNDGNQIQTTARYKELLDQFSAISKSSSNEKNHQSIYTKLKTTNQEAKAKYQQQSSSYRFCTRILRLSNIFRKSDSTFLDKILIKKGYALPNDSFTLSPAADWFDRVIENLADYKSLNNFSIQMQKDQGKAIKLRYEALAAKHPTLNIMGDNYSGNTDLMLSFKMEGVAIIGSYLKQKHGLENLFVCDSLEAFQYQLKEISESPEDCRASFLIGVRGMGKNQSYMPENQHKATVCLEKVGDQLKIILLDGQPDTINEEILEKKARDLKDLRFAGASTAAFWSIYQSGVDLNKVELFRSNMKREFGAYGCETFALRDAVDFLNSPDFFDKIQKDPIQKSGVITNVNRLPPRFMKTTQSLASLNKYMSEHPDEAVEMIPRSRKDPSTLKQTVKKHKAKGYNRQGILKNQNHYTSFRSLKYHLMALEAMEQLTTDELKVVLDDTLVRMDRAPLKKGKEPKTMHDLFEVYWKDV